MWALPASRAASLGNGLDFLGPRLLRDSPEEKRPRRLLSATLWFVASLEASLARNLRQLGITHLTQVQDACFLPILLGKDVVAAAKPGTGKTLAYLLPLLQRSLNSSFESTDGAGEAPAECVDARGPTILILVPTRELCRQVASTVSALAPALSVAVLDASWASLHAQQLLLDSFARGGGKQLDVVVGAPERCEKLFQSGHLRLGHLRACVIDEADALMRRGYADKIESLFYLQTRREDAETQRANGNEGEKQTGCESAKKRDYPRHRVQTLIFTAAMPRDLQHIVEGHFRHAAIFNLLKKTTLRAPNELATSASPLFSPATSAASAAPDPSSAVASTSSTTLCSDTVRHLKCKISRSGGSESETRLRTLLYLLARALPSATHRNLAATARDSRREGRKKGEEEREKTDQTTFQLGGAHLQSLETETHKCIVFVETQQEVSVLVATDVAARGLDVPGVTLVVHLRPPRNPGSYIHRSGRAGRGGHPGDSVVLYSPSERDRVTKIVQETQTRFINLPPPTEAQQQETAIARILYELLEVKEEHFRPLLPRAEALIEAHGPSVFAAALAFLQGKHRAPRLTTEPLGTEEDVCRSLLTGRKGFASVLVYDPAHQALDSTAAAARYLRARLPESARYDAVGLVCKSVNGYVGDVAVVYANQLVDDGDVFSERKETGSWSGPPVYPLEQLPKLVLSEEAKRLGRRRRRVQLPWAKMKQQGSGSSAIVLGRRRKGEVLRTVADIKQHQRGIAKL
ncbi:putative RNA helicase [Neospora caninum Liverpool]|uniref:RNA helicase n=1 Tax=Neospora caninum (strain Liverpool) TaxID=572307 RepID=F0VLW4_NEOCL|nr:putative RNA helicase [Neospora caninum Liverpool]CBZ54242.1 putative RNA helicase [Neospora caninum Liverpool]|eukprot:XP_003884273.1 putative RNA helicase [Neospora caninum Liverpool]